jgi:hypothetical protein
VIPIRHASEWPEVLLVAFKKSLSTMSSGGIHIDVPEDRLYLLGASASGLN